MTIPYLAPVVTDSPAAVGVYPPQQDSQLLVYAMETTGLVPGARVLDICTGSGFVAIAAAELGAASVTAFDVCPRAVHCSRGNAVHAGVEVDVREGSWTRAHDCGPFDLVVCNPPYVPTPPDGDTKVIPHTAGPSRAWNAGIDGRLLLDPLCDAVFDLLADGGSTLLVHSELAGTDQSLNALRKSGLRPEVVATQIIPFGPVMSARAGWLEETGRIPHGRRTEELVVIRADKR